MDLLSPKSHLEDCLIKLATYHIHRHMCADIHPTLGGIHRYIKNSKGFRERWKRKLLYIIELPINSLKYFFLSQVFISCDSCRIYTFYQVFSTIFSVNLFNILWLASTKHFPWLYSYLSSNPVKQQVLLEILPSYIYLSSNSTNHLFRNPFTSAVTILGFAVERRVLYFCFIWTHLSLQSL